LVRGYEVDERAYSSGFVGVESARAPSYSLGGWVGYIEELSSSAPGEAEVAALGEKRTAPIYVVGGLLRRSRCARLDVVGSGNRDGR